MCTTHDLRKIKKIQYEKKILVVHIFKTTHLSAHSHHRNGSSCLWEILPLWLIDQEVCIDQWEPTFRNKKSLSGSLSTCMFVWYRTRMKICTQFIVYRYESSYWKVSDKSCNWWALYFISYQFFVWWYSLIGVVWFAFHGKQNLF